jgi:uncharacterized protein
MKCPTCHKETEFEGNAFRPFCSERCKMIDLGRWAGEQYRVPSVEKPPEEIHASNGNREDED